MSYYYEKKKKRKEKIFGTETEDKKIKKKS